MACIQCGCCVSDCLAMEVDPGFIGPAALAKAYRFAGDPRDGQHEARLRDLAEDPQGIYDCTHCFMCIDACPKGVDPMNQIMRLRRLASSDYEIEDSNNGYRHEHAFTDIIEKKGTLDEAALLPDSYGGKFHPRAGAELIDSLPVIVTALLRRKVTPAKALFHPKLPDQKQIKRIYERVHGRDQRFELNLYITGYDEDPADAAGPGDKGEGVAHGGASAPGPEGGAQVGVDT
jgi:succinate dehydrogenase / fumarate reductase iron-sulfur subunit